MENKDGCCVPFMYGPIGAAHPYTGLKLYGVTRQEAIKCYDLIITEKFHKGYYKATYSDKLEALLQVVSDRTSVSSTEEPREPAKTTTPEAASTQDSDAQVFKYYPVKAIGYTEVIDFIKKENYCCYESHYGKRIGVVYSRGYVKIFNNNGKYTSLPKQLDYLLSTFAMQSGINKYTIEANWCEDDLYIYDILQYDGEDVYWRDYVTRISILEKVAHKIKDEHVHIVQAAYTIHQKKSLVKRLLEEEKEAIVFRDIDDNYDPKGSAYIYTLK